MTASIAGMPLLPGLLPPGGTFSQQRRADWEQSSFAGLFDANFPSGKEGDAGRAQGIPEGAATSQPVAQTEHDAPAINPLQWNPAPFPDRTEAAVRPAAFASAPDRANAAPVAMASSERTSGQTGAPRTVSIATVAKGDPSTPDPSEQFADHVVVVAESDARLRVSVRAKALQEGDIQRLVAAIRAELSWKGLALDQLSINGRRAWGSESESEDKPRGSGGASWR